ncbi:MAG: YbaN family protein [Romboutsia sp.]|uniref:YbaN family protein n=1 Tax=Romboutsia sp. TaxID=1965302 RepID=UPI003F40A496
MKIIIFIIGILSTGLGFIGVFLPVIPTTPLLLLSLYCFSKSSSKFENWLLNTQMYKNHLEDFVKNKEMTFKKKVLLVSFATTMMMFPLVILDSYIVKVFILLILVYLYYYFIFKIKTI